MNPPSIPNESVTAPAKTRRLPIFIVLGSIVTVVIVVFVIVILPRLRSTTDQGSLTPQLYVKVDNAKTRTLNLVAFDGHDGSLKWTSHDDISAESLPTISKNTVAFFDEKSALHMLNAVTGATLWSWKNAGIDYGSDSTHVYLNTGGTLSNSTENSQISALNIQNGHEDWHISVSQYASIVVADNIPYLLNDTRNGNSYLARLDPKTGAAIWRNETMTERLGDIVGPFDDTIYVLGQTTPYAVDVKTGSIRWHLPLASGEGSARTIIACGQATVCLLQGDGSVTAVNAVSGKQQWRYAFNHPTNPSEFFYGFSFGVNDNFIVIHASKNIAVIHRDNGSLAWEKTLIGSNSVSFNPYPIGNGVIYVNIHSSDAAPIDYLNPVTTTAFDVATGRTLWQSTKNDMRPGSPVLLGNVVVTANSRTITAFAAKTGDVLWNRDFVNPGDLSLGSGVIGAFVP